MNKITVVSAIRQDAPYLDVYLRQLSLQSREHFELVSVVLVHDGDGAILRDRLAQLRDLALNVVLVRELASDGDRRQGHPGLVVAVVGGRLRQHLGVRAEVGVRFDQAREDRPALMAGHRILGVRGR